MSARRSMRRTAGALAVPALVAGMASLAVVGAPGADATPAGVPPEPHGYAATIGTTAVPAGLEQAAQRAGLRTGLRAASGATPAKGRYRQTGEVHEPVQSAGDMFGLSVSLSSNGKTAVIGAEATSGWTGAAYVFKANKKGAWKLAASLTASDGQMFDDFGTSVAISGDGTTVAVGATGTHNLAGSIYVFTGSGKTWKQKAELTAKDGQIADSLGWSLALSGTGTTLLSGAIQSDSDPGKAYVFRANKSGRWRQAAELTASDGVAGDQFGYTVSLASNGHAAAISATERDPGAVYVFTGSGAKWSQQAELTAGDGTAGDNFGAGLAISGDGSTVVVGADLHSAHAEDDGVAYIFAGSGGSWSQTAELTSAADEANAYFGRSASINANGSKVVVGASGQDDVTGAAFVFASRGGTWVQKAELTASDGQSEDDLGGSVSMSGSGATVLVGAFGADQTSGAAYVFSSR